ncbi:hypothetical protein PG994_011589 [Apiospora phragmitis]|uniref:J domain-containing protein n=1 Tax=Apiospora phragmitis TaxID=2905665 RepID=A0ABR1TT82_9PEZI
MKGLFSSKKPSASPSPTKKHPTGENDENRSPHANRYRSGSTSPIKTAPQAKPVGRKPVRSASPTQKDLQKDLPAAPPSSARSRSTRSFGSSSSSSRRNKIDPNTHPLNLPPDEYKRLSALSAAAMSDRSLGRSSIFAPGEASAPPKKKVTVPINIPTNTNGTKEPTNDEGPAPPPHRSNPSSPVPTTEDEAESYKAAGNKFFKERDYRNAIIQYSRAVELVPNSATYLSNRAAAYMSHGQYEAALGDCSRAVDLDPTNAKFLLRLARIYTSLGRPKEALTTFSRIQPPASAKDMAPAKEMSLHVKAAQDALVNGTSGSMVLHALDQAEKLLGIGAMKPRKWQLMRGAAHLKIGGINSLGEAQNVAMSLLRYNSQDPEALVLRGRALYCQGDNDKAIQHFRKALSCDPDFRDAVKWLRTVQKLDRMKEEGNSDYKAGRWQAAFDKYSSALEVDPANRGTNAKLLQNRALCRLKLKQYNEAVADCDRAVSLDPHARKTKANALGQADRWEDAVREWKSIQEMDPEDRTIPKEIRKAELELKKSQRKDYYKILNVDKNADDVQIKKAYRKLAIVHHPDKNPGDDAAAERFKDIGEAYETLSDPQKRARYDSGEDLVDPSDMFSGGGGMGGMGGGMGGIDPEILFSMMNGGGGFGGGENFEALASQLVVAGDLVVSLEASNLADNPSLRKMTILPKKASRTTGKAIIHGNTSTKAHLMKQRLVMLISTIALLVFVDGVSFLLLQLFSSRVSL